MKCDGTRAETRLRLSTKRTSTFKSAGASVQSTAGSRGVRISGSNAGYTTFRGSAKGTGYAIHSPVSPSLPSRASPCAITFQLASITVFSSKTSGSTFLLQTHFTYLEPSTVTCTCAFLPPPPPPPRPHGAKAHNVPWPLHYRGFASHTHIYNTRQESSGRVVSPSQRPRPDTQQSQQTFMPPAVFEHRNPSLESGRRPKP